MIGWCMLLVIVANAQPTTSTNTLYFKNGSIALPANAQQMIDSLSQLPLNTPIQVVLQFHELSTLSQRETLAASGVTVLQYLGANAYSALLAPSSIQQLPVNWFRCVLPFQLAWKMEPRVWQLSKDTSTTSSNLALSFTQLSQEKMEAFLIDHRAKILSRKFSNQRVYEIRISNKKIYTLAASPYVTYITIQAEDQPINNDERAMTGASLLSSSLAMGGLNLNGATVTVGVGDNSSGLFHTDTRDRIINFNPDPMELHGQHVTGTIAGKGIINPRGKGLAPNATVLAHLYNLVWAQTAPMFQDYNMTLTNNSYAAVVNDCAVAGMYDIYSQMLDSLALQFPKVLNVFAAGNDGNKSCPPYPTGYGTVVGIYQPAKNVLTVSSIRKNYTVHQGASKGPVKDGRIKPEVVSFGAGLYSCALNDGYIAINGTSMACPGATGALALLTQQYKQLYNTNPENALLKALLINGAVDVGTKGPDYINGFGLINVYRSSEILKNNFFEKDTAIQGASENFSINVPSNTAQLKVLLYWNDAPANPAMAKALVNNLDLTVTEPNNTLHHPLILDATPTNVTNQATEGVDTLNNVEQVVIDNPMSGNYTINVKGTSLPSSSQPYYLVYDFVPVGIKLKYPSTAIPVPANETVTIFWDASDNLNLLTLEYSIDNGNTWVTIDNAIGANEKFYSWNVPNINTEQAIVRIKRNNTSQQATSGVFTINLPPTLQAATVQCPGYFAFDWNAISNATQYQILKKIGDDLVSVDTVNSTQYVLKNLPLDSICYVAVAPFINGQLGFRSVAISRLPNQGSCSGTITDGDLMVQGILSPKTGRQHTSIALTANESMTILVRNLDDVTVANFKISFKVNNSGWQSQTFTTTIPANAVAPITVSGLNLASVGSYKIQVAVENLSAIDVNSINDTIDVVVKQLANPPLNIQNLYLDNSETTPIQQYYQDENGVLNEHWDFTNSSDSGRLRNFVSNDVLISGSRSISLDLLYSLPENRNYLTGTYNLATLDATNDEARVQFDYKLHGTPKFQDGNDVFIRGNDTSPWVKLLDFDTTVAKGAVINSGSLSLSHFLTNAGQNFSSSFQIRFGQHDTSAIAMNDYGNGWTLDNFKLYTVKNDVQLLSIKQPKPFNCQLLQDETITVMLYNSDNLPQSNIQLFYRLDNGAIVADTLATLAAKDSVQFSFTKTVSLAAPGWHQLDVWLVANGDTYLPNDSILQFKIRNQPEIKAFPYLENFETDEGHWYAEGVNSTWQYGTPSGTIINKAASGTKAWKTNLSGKYSNNEISYLYSPCFDISNLKSPMLSFSRALEIEDCGTNICDKAYVEYSADGINWQKLGVKDSGTNWYNNGVERIWNGINNTRWQVSSYPLPKLSSLKLRFVLRTDMGSAFEGLAVDDIHIYDFEKPIFLNGLQSSVDDKGVDKTKFESNGQVIAEIVDSNSSLGNVDWNAFFHHSVFVPLMEQFYIPRNFVLQTELLSASSLGIKFYITDKEFLKVYENTECAACEKPEDIYRMGILNYHDVNSSHENGSWLDNRSSFYSFIPASSITWVPYDNGYYASFETDKTGEFWITTGIPKKTVKAVFVYPNPVVAQQFQLVWQATLGATMEVTLFNAIGSKVFTTTIKATDVDNTSTITLPTLANGVYMMHYKSALESGKMKLTIKNL